MTQLDHDTAKELVENLIMNEMKHLRESSFRYADNRGYYVQLNDLFDNWDVVPVEPDDDGPFNQDEFNVRVGDDIGRLQAEQLNVRQRIEELAKVVNAHAASIKTAQQAIQLHDSELGDLEYRVDKLERP